MRDAFGGVFMIRLFLVFIVIYVSFTAISLNYAKAFRVKNNVISFIEEQEITDLYKFFEEPTGKKVEKLKHAISAADYNKICTNGNGKIDTGPGGNQRYCYQGVVIDAHKSTKTIKYTIYTFAGWNLWSLNEIVSFEGKNPDAEGIVNGGWTISGEAVVKIRN